MFSRNNNNNKNPPNHIQFQSHRLVILLLHCACIYLHYCEHFLNGEEADKLQNTKCTHHFPLKYSNTNFKVICNLKESMEFSF